MINVRFFIVYKNFIFHENSWKIENHRKIIFFALIIIGGMIKMNGQNRKNIKTGSEVYIVLKKDQRTGKWTKGIVKVLLTKKSFHPHGIKVRLQSGQVGRVQEVINE